MTASPAFTRQSPLPLVTITAIGAPVAMLIYGILRLIDGLDGDHGPGPAWNAGHVMLLLAFALFGVLLTSLRRRIPVHTGWQRALAAGAAIAGVAGVLCAGWVTLGDLVPWLDDNASLPDPVSAAGLLLFEFGMLAPLVMLTAIRPRRLPIASPVLVFVGMASITVNLDLLPVSATLILLGLAPLARRSATLDR